MSMDQDRSLAAVAELRHRAEELLRAKTARQKLPRTEEETQRLVFELEVHQIELEMQIAELSQARLEVEKALEKYTDLYDCAPVGYLSLEGNGAISAVNLHGAHLLASNRSELIGQSFGRFIAKADRQRFSDFLGEVLASRDKENCELVLASNEFHTKFVQIEAVADAAGKDCRMVLIDVTERRRVEAALSQKKIELAMSTIWYAPS